MSVPQEAIEAAAKTLYEAPWGGPLLPWEEATEVNKLVYRQRAAACLAEALPAIEKEIRAAAAPIICAAERKKIVEELRNGLPTALHEGADSAYGWLSDAEELYPKADPSNEYVWLMSYDDSHSLGSIDISHVAEHAV